VSGCSLEKSFRSRHNSLYSFPRNLAPDFTQLSQERSNKTESQTERYESKNVVRRAILFQRDVSSRTEQFGAVTHIHCTKVSKFTIRYPEKTQGGARWSRPIALAE
jgi:hypothetical protein